MGLLLWESEMKSSLLLPPMWNRWSKRQLIQRVVPSNLRYQVGFERRNWPAHKTVLIYTAFLWANVDGDGDGDGDDDTDKPMKNNEIGRYCNWDPRAISAASHLVCLFNCEWETTDYSEYIKLSKTEKCSKFLFSDEEILGGSKKRKTQERNGSGVWLTCC